MRFSKKDQPRRVAVRLASYCPALGCAAQQEEPLPATCIKGSVQSDKWFRSLFLFYPDRIQTECDRTTTDYEVRCKQRLGNMSKNYEQLAYEVGRSGNWPSVLREKNTYQVRYTNCLVSRSVETRFWEPGIAGAGSKVACPVLFYLFSFQTIADGSMAFQGFARSKTPRFLTYQNRSRRSMSMIATCLKWLWTNCERCWLGKLCSTPPWHS